ncbi:deoxyribodipyrimidine photo-lyase [Neolewinella lacunae]|uniref:Deoxyribodipyrimidine photo-lyase n=1 Tax=Neolewinella lacunae TaxID=1517758 RepID=A0A923PT46_9BACT|nr:deoxyribodipyrimidine photo-lyase [Neolewinella lacunae]MBC6996322.1 deoxyribodipyrimidine photo-lyase [Neolewinella lacunae]MDN3636945.1 deoxyribodipyrimidine photo-lyase [Neolewinella lacunae]
MKARPTIFWHRRDLRFPDNAGLYRALKAGGPVLPIFIFDQEILRKLEDPRDARVTFIHRSVTELAEAYRSMGSDLRVYYGKPLEVWAGIVKDLQPRAVYTNRDYEPYARERDGAVEALLEKAGATFHHYKDHLIFEGKEVQKNDGGPYTVYTPFWNKWRERLKSRMSTFEGKEISYYLKPYPNEKYAKNLLPVAKPGKIISLQEMGFEPARTDFPPTEVSRKLIQHYDETRDFPGTEGTSRLGVHFRHGTISIREKARRAQGLNETYLKELVWRDFYSNILQHFPYVVEGPFREEYAAIPWENNEDHFAAWCAGRTGVPLVDAGMRQLNATGYMHNRVRMIVASYLTKHLLINWQWGEHYFAKKLLDFELASNNGGWQWAASCGTDAQPYFRIFNYESQQKKFDPDFTYVKAWVPEFGTPEYPSEPLVEHKFGRERALEVYKKALAEAKRG